MTVSLILILDIMECLEVGLNIVWYASRDQIELRNTLEFIRLCLFTIKLIIADDFLPDIA